MDDAHSLPRGAHPLPYWSEGSCGQTFLDSNVAEAESQCLVEGEDGYKNQEAYCNLEANDTLLFPLQHFSKLSGIQINAKI